jgi:hypothetical protein
VEIYHSRNVNAFEEIALGTNSSLRKKLGTTF